jgi:hypothetical protein
LINSWLLMITLLFLMVIASATKKYFAGFCWFYGEICLFWR